MNNQVLNLTGQKFGIWLVIEQAPRRDNKTRWLCQCTVCGQTRSLRSTTLRISTYAACDGRHTERLNRRETSPRIKPPGYAAATECWHRYRIVAKKRGLPCTLSRETFVSIAQQACHYCGIEPQQRNAKSYYNGTFVYNGLDRKDSMQGYTQENCLPCCGLCNVMKQDLPYETFLAHIAQIQQTHPRTPQAASKKHGMTMGLGGRPGPSNTEIHDTSIVRAQRYGAIAALHHTGKTLIQIASILNIARMTAYRGLIASGCIQPRTYKPRTANHA